MSKKIESRIIRLKSGDDVIAKIVNSNSKKITLERPFVFRVSIVTDPFSGVRKEVTTLQSWLPYADTNQITIATDNVLAFLPPTEETEKLYVIERDREEKIKNNRSVTNYGPQEDTTTEPESPLSDMINKFNGANPGSFDDMMKKLQEDIDNLANDVDFPDDMNEEDMQEFIVMTLMIPPNMIEKMIKEGIIKPSDMADYLYDAIKEKVTEEYTGDEDNHPDYGNRWTDWSNDLDDYLKP